MQVIQTRGPLLETDNYYPFGLSMAGISSKSANKLENKIRFQKQEFENKEFSDGSGLEMYEFKYRFDDCQIGRFWSNDPLADKYVYNSPYAFSENMVTTHVELEGREAEWFVWDYYSERNRIRDEQGKDAQSQFDQGYGVGVKLAASIGAGYYLGISFYGMKDAFKELKNNEEIVSLNNQKSGLFKEIKETENSIKTLGKSEKSFKKLIEEHQQKLETFKKDPVANTKKELIENKSATVKEKVINGRVKSLEKQIKKQMGELNKVQKELTKQNAKLINQKSQLDKIDAQIKSLQ